MVERLSGKKEVRRWTGAVREKQYSSDPLSLENAAGWIHIFYVPRVSGRTVNRGISCLESVMQLRPTASCRGGGSQRVRRSNGVRQY